MRFRTLMGMVAACALVASACGGGQESTDEVDRDAWRAELTALDGIRDDPDLDTLERLTREDCDKDVDSLALRYSLEGARADMARVNMKHVCPDDIGKLDQALEELDQLG